MRSIAAVVIICTGLVYQTLGEPPLDRSSADPWTRADVQLRRSVTDLQAIGEMHPNDIEIQLGLACLYSRPGPRGECSLSEQIEKVLAIDPSNSAACAIKARSLCTGYTSKRNALIDELNGVIASARQRSAQELIVPSYSRLYPWLKQNSLYGEVVGHLFIQMQNVKSARASLRDTLNKEADGILAALGQAEKQDPQNALYNYLRAHVHFELDQQDKAVAQIEKAVAKKYLNTYFKERRNAVARVLQEIDFPKDWQPFITDRYSPFGDFIAREIWREELRPLARDYETQRAFEDAARLYTLALGIAKQVREEPLPYPSLFNESFSQTLEKWAKQRKEAISRKMGNR